LPSDLRGRVDVGIITFRQDEYDAVYRRLHEPRLVQCQERIYAYSAVPTRDGGRACRVCLLKSHASGNGPSQVATGAMIAHLDPHWIMAVGIAGAIPAAEFSLGDVIVATEIKDLRQKAELYGRPPETEIRASPVHRRVRAIASALRVLELELDDWSTGESIDSVRPAIALDDPKNVFGPRAWRLKLLKYLKRHSESGRSTPIAHSGPIASSESLMKDPESAERWLRSVRGILAFEMEAAGILDAADCGDHEYPVFVIRGLSDIVGFVRDDDWASYACDSAAALAIALIKTGRLEPIPRPS
jgi:nucleoside phosphorylase